MWNYVYDYRMASYNEENSTIDVSQEVGAVCLHFVNVILDYAERIYALGCNAFWNRKRTSWLQT